MTLNYWQLKYSGRGISIIRAVFLLLGLTSYLLSLLLLAFSQHSGAQPLDMDLFHGMQPRNIGPAGMSGRVTAIDVVRKDPRRIYIGTASGGLWHSDNGGLSWSTVFENEEASSVGAVAIDQNNPAVLWIGTGEGNPRNSLTSGYGMYKNIDGGKSWKHLGLENTRNIHRVILHPDNSDVAWVAAIGEPNGYRSTGDDLFVGENREPGALISFYVRETMTDTAENKKQPKAVIEVIQRPTGIDPDPQSRTPKGHQPHHLGA